MSRGLSCNHEVRPAVAAVSELNLQKVGALRKTDKTDGGIVFLGFLFIMENAQYVENRDALDVVALDVEHFIGRIGIDF